MGAIHGMTVGPMGGGYMKIERSQEKQAKSNGELIGGLRKRIMATFFCKLSCRE